ncbi:MAG: YCF48-related protein [Bacteroidia bacterium]
MQKATLVLSFGLLLSIGEVKAQGTWSSIFSGTTTNLLGVSAPTATDTYVCGATGTIRKSSDTGISWIPLSSGTGQNLYSIEFMDALTGYVVGDNGTAMKTTDGGSTWNAMTIGTTVNLRSIHFIDPLTGFITGSGGLILKTTDGGTTWNPCTVPTGAIINGVAFTSPTNGYAAGAAGVALKTISSGATWGALTSGVGTGLNSVYFTSGTNGVMCGDNGIIIRTVASGTSWSTIATGTTDALSGMDFYDANNGFIVGGSVPLDAGTIFTTTDGGATWSNSVPGCSRLLKVDMYNSTLGYAVGLDGTILQYVVPATPDASFASSTPGCAGQSESFYSVMATVPGVTHSWSFGAGAIPATSASANPTGVVYSTFGAKIVTHIATTGAGADTSTMVITINPSPSAVFTYTTPSCAMETVNFNNFGTTGAGITYSWDFGAGASPLLSTSENPGGVIYTFGGPKTITFNVTNQYGCVTSSMQTISIDSLPLANAGMDTTICFNTSAQIGAPAVPGMTYSWSPSSTLSSGTAANPTASPVAPLTEYIVTVTNTTTGCSSKDTMKITMLPVLMANAGADASICINDSAQIGTGLILGQTYTWVPSTGLSDSTAANPFAKPSGTMTYTLTVTANGCGSVSDEVTVNVHNLPSVSAGMPDTITTGGSAQLNATGGILYVWAPSATLDNPGIYNPIASPATTTTYTCNITDLFGCSRNAAVTVYVVEPGFWLPTAFSPDGNGSSDIFIVRGEGIQGFEFNIFNRWGERIFHTQDLLTGWDGTRQSTGDKLPEGAYVYEVRGKLSDGTVIDSKGIVNLIR